MKRLFIINVIMAKNPDILEKERLNLANKLVERHEIDSGLALIIANDAISAVLNDVDYDAYDAAYCLAQSGLIREDETDTFCDICNDAYDMFDLNSTTIH